MSDNCVVGDEKLRVLSCVRRTVSGVKAGDKLSTPLLCVHLGGFWCMYNLVEVGRYTEHRLQNRISADGSGYEKSRHHIEDRCLPLYLTIVNHYDKAKVEKIVT